MLVTGRFCPLSSPIAGIPRALKDSYLRNYHEARKRAGGHVSHLEWSTVSSCSSKGKLEKRQIEAENFVSHVNV
jgi:hypothetical protein